MLQPILLLIALMLSSSLSAQTGETLLIEEVSPGIFVHFGSHETVNRSNHGAIANIGFIVGQRCVAVIDSGGNPQQGYQLKKAVKSITALPICYVINTHVHPDHIFGNRAFKNSSAKFVGHFKLPRAMSMRGQYYLDKSPDQIGFKLIADDIIPPDIVVQDTLTLDLGGRKLLLTAYPTAHTDNDISVYDSQTNTLWLSDLLFVSHIPVVDGSLTGWLKVLAKLEKKNFGMVIPGHGSVVKNWPKGMQAEKHYLQKLLIETRDAIKRGQFLEDALNTIGQSESENWLLFDQFHKKNISTSFAELEWED